MRSFERLIELQVERGEGKPDQGSVRFGKFVSQSKRLP